MMSNSQFFKNSIKIFDFLQKTSKIKIVFMFISSLIFSFWYRSALLISLIILVYVSILIFVYFGKWFFINNFWITLGLKHKILFIRISKYQQDKNSAYYTDDRKDRMLLEALINDYKLIESPSKNHYVASMVFYNGFKKLDGFIEIEREVLNSQIITKE